MNAAVYARLLTPLAERFRIIASDARGHGQTDLPADPDDLTDWATFADDLLALLDAVDPAAAWQLAGHSMGGSVSALAAVRAPGRVAGVTLLDPAMVPFAQAPAYAAARSSGIAPPNPMAERAARRRADFADPAEAFAAYAGRGLFKGWDPADLNAYLDGGLRPSGAGVTLGCAPAWEAATFRAVATDIEAAIVGLTCPIALVAGETGSTVADADFAAIAALPHCIAAARIGGTTHFVPLERPALVRDAIAAVTAASSR
jgi:pimeloyl-ACP methyl ester carboxylesterase